MTKNLRVRLDDELAADAEALARVEGKSLNETIKHALAEAVQRRREDPEFRKRVRRIIEQDRELLGSPGERPLARARRLPCDCRRDHRRRPHHSHRTPPLSPE